MLRASAAAVAIALAASAATAQERDCEALEDLRLTDVNILSAVEIPADEDLPAYCSLRGYVRPAINFEVRLPEDWNGGFYMAGCGGFCGQLLSDAPGFINAINPGLRRGYAAATMDGGHWGTGSTDARWAFHDRRAEVDWGRRAVSETARVAEAAIEAHYSEAPEPSIFQGCSTGGRMASMVALTDPEMFDGIINGAPALDYTGLVATWMASVVRQNTSKAGEQIVTPDVVDRVAGHVLAQCDATDGLEDGLISDPRACEVDLAPLACGEGGDDCLSEAQIAVLGSWYETGAVNRSGERLYPATVPYGSEPYWWLWLTGNEEGGGRLVPVFNEQFLQFMAFADDPGEGFTARDFDFGADPARLETMAGIYNSDDPDLSAFRDAGGKMLLWHGWADAIVPPGKTLDYYGAILDEMGGREAVDPFLRLFLIPGMDHCGILSGPGIDQSGFDPLSAMEAWLADGAAPERIETEKRVDGETVWRRPVCRHPRAARFEGEGDWRSGEGFVCE